MKASKLAKEREDLKAGPKTPSQRPQQRPQFSKEENKIKGEDLVLGLRKWWRRTTLTTICL